MKTPKEKIEKMEKEIEFFGGKDFATKGLIFSEITENEGYMTAFVKDIKLEGYKEAISDIRGLVKKQMNLLLIKYKKFQYKSCTARATNFYRRELINEIKEELLSEIEGGKHQGGKQE